MTNEVLEYEGTMEELRRICGEKDTELIKTDIDDDVAIFYNSLNKIFIGCSPSQKTINAVIEMIHKSR